jgi:uncharacterized protein (TIGR03083 family)
MSASRDVAQIEPVTRRTDAQAVAEAAYRQLLSLLETLSDRDWSAQTSCPGWTVSDMVGHLIGAAHGTSSLRTFSLQQLWGFRHARAFGGNPLDALNELQIREQSQVPDSQRAAVLRAAAPESVRGRLRLSARMGALTVPISAAGSATGMPRSVNLGRLFDVVYTRDVWMHTIDIAQATGRELPMTEPVNQRIVEDVVVDWVRRHRRPVDLVLTGPAGGRFRSRSGGDAVEIGAVEFCQVLSGREPGEGLLTAKVLF